MEEDWSRYLDAAKSGVEYWVGPRKVCQDRPSFLGLALKGGMQTPLLRQSSTICICIVALEYQSQTVLQVACLDDRKCRRISVLPCCSYSSSVDIACAICQHSRSRPQPSGPSTRIPAALVTSPLASCLTAPVTFVRPSSDVGQDGLMADKCGKTG